MKRHAPAALRNREPILSVLAELLVVPEGRRPLLLEIASGSGEHVVHFARALPDWDLQPSDADPAARASVDAHRAEAGLANVRSPVALDAREDSWPVARADAVVCINMIHIAPWSACVGLGRGAARVLPPGVLLVLYGPFRFDGAFTAPSNEAFDASLRARDPEWGVRDLSDVTAIFAERGFSRTRIVEMPANNHVVVFQRG